MTRIWPWTRLTPVLATLIAAGTTPAAAQETRQDRLSVHGFLTQAFGITDGPQYLGIPARGTTDYRTAALQFRYDMTDRDAFVLQVSHERYGLSPLNNFRSDVALDWAFYQRRVGDHTMVRVGKIKMPFGIYNEIRDVGTLLPLYRPPLSHYGELAYSSETLNGVAVGHRLPLGDRWAVSVDGFVGGWEYLQFDLETMAQVDRGTGLQAWVETPVTGLRAGVGGRWFSASNIAMTPPDQRDKLEIWQGSLDGQFQRFMVRAEGYTGTFRDATYQSYTGWFRGAYAQFGLHLTRQLTVIGQADIMRIGIELPNPQPPLPAGPLTTDWTADRDIALAVRYAASPHLVLKLEGHRYRGYTVETRTPDPFMDPPVRLHYALFSVSTSF